MKAILNSDFLFSHDGVAITKYKKDEEVSGIVAQSALAQNKAETEDNIKAKADAQAKVEATKQKPTNNKALSPNETK